MVRSVAKKVLWLGRATVFVMGLALMLALVFGMASTALGANGGNFILGSLNNSATAITKLTGTVGGGPALQVSNPSTATGSTALDLQVATGKAPMKVNRSTKVTNLNADKIDGLDSAQLAQGRISKSGTPSQSFGAIVEHFEGFGNYGVGLRKVVSHPEQGNPIDISISCTNQSTAGTLRIENMGEFGDSQFVWVDDGSTNPSFTSLLADNFTDRPVPTGSVQGGM